MRFCTIAVLMPKATVDASFIYKQNRIGAVETYFSEMGIYCIARFVDIFGRDLY